MKESRASVIAGDILARIESGALGRSGERFPTVRQLADAYQTSFDNIMKVFDFLCGRHLIRPHGKRYYLTTGYAAPDTPYGALLARQGRPCLGLILHTISNQYFASLSSAVSLAAAEAGYQLLIACSDNDSRRESSLIDGLIDVGVRGIITCPNLDTDVDMYARCPLPLVSVGYDLMLPNCDSIQVDNLAAARQVANHLLNIGCTRFTYIGLRAHVERDQRLRGFSDVLARRGRPLDRDHIIAVDDHESAPLNPSALSGRLYRVLKALKPGERLGLFCYHDLIALAALQAVRECSSQMPRPMSIPEDVAVVGFDDLPIASVVAPAMTSVAYRYQAIAEKAMAVMRDYIENPLHKTGRYEIPSSLRIRASTMAAR